MTMLKALDRLPPNLSSIRSSAHSVKTIIVTLMCPTPTGNFQSPTTV